MQFRRTLRYCGLPALAVAAVALVRWLSDRGFLGESPPSPQLASSGDLAGFIVAAGIVLATVAFAARFYDSRWAAFLGSLVAGVAANAYSVVADWHHAGWGGLVDHDMWFGDHDYWVLVTIRVIVVVMTFAVVVTATWGIVRRARPHQAG